MAFPLKYFRRLHRRFFTDLYIFYTPKNRFFSFFVLLNFED